MAAAVTAVQVLWQEVVAARHGLAPTTLPKSWLGTSRAGFCCLICFSATVLFHFCASGVMLS
jgi:hypothetical protein